MNDKLGDALKFDSLGEAEKITSNEYKEDKNTTALGMLLMQQNSAKKEAMLKANNDTYWGMTWDEFCNILNTRPVHHFEKIYSESFVFEAHGGGPEEVIVWADFTHGILITANSFTGSLNSGSFYYQGLVKGKNRPDGSGGFNNYDDIKEQGVYSGHFDIREGLFYKLDKLCGQLESFDVPWTIGENQTFGPHVWFPVDKGRSFCEVFDKVFANVPAEKRAIFEVIKFGREDEAPS